MSLFLYLVHSIIHECNSNVDKAPWPFEHGLGAEGHRLRATIVGYYWSLLLRKNFLKAPEIVQQDQPWGPTMPPPGGRCRGGTGRLVMPSEQAVTGHSPTATNKSMADVEAGMFQKEAGHVPFKLLPVDLGQGKSRWQPAG